MNNMTSTENKLPLKIKDLKFYKHFPQAEIRKLYDHLVTFNKGKEFVTHELMSSQLQLIKQKDFTVDQYIKFIDEQVNGKEPKKLGTSGANRPDIRRKAGYSKKVWTKIEVVENNLRKALENLVSEFLTKLVLDGVGFEGDLFNQTETEFNTRWKNFCRKHIIPYYPSALNSDEDGKKLRTKIMGLFLEKSKEAITELS